MNILYVHSHPYAKSFHAAIRDSYVAAAKKADHAVEVINLGESSFDPVLRFGYSEFMPQDDVIDLSQKLVKWADRIVFAYPLWWGGPPSLLTGWIARVFTPGFSYRTHGLLKSERLLTGKSADIIVTSRTPRFLWSFTGNIGVTLLTQNLFVLTGIKKRRIAVLDNMSLKADTPARREKFLRRVSRMGSGK